MLALTTFAPVTLPPVPAPTVRLPDTLAPVPLTTTILALPAELMVTLPLAVAIFTLLLPLLIELVESPLKLAVNSICCG